MKEGGYGGQGEERLERDAGSMTRERANGTIPKERVFVLQRRERVSLAMKGMAPKRRHRTRTVVSIDLGRVVERADGVHP